MKMPQVRAWFYAFLAIGGLLFGLSSFKGEPLGLDKGGGRVGGLNIDVEGRASDFNKSGSAVKIAANRQLMTARKRGRKRRGSSSKTQKSSRKKGAYRFRVISLNTGAAHKNRIEKDCKHWAANKAVRNESETGINTRANYADTAMVGLRRLLVREAGRASAEGVKGLVFALQEVEVRTRRNKKWDMPAYFRDRLASASNNPWRNKWNRVFLPAINHCHAGPAICKLIDYNNSSKCKDCGEFGLATLASAPVQKTIRERLQWYQASAFEDSTGDLSNYSHYAKEPRVALASKVKVKSQPLWIINTHLGGYTGKNAQNEPIVDERIATRQIWQLLGLAGRFDPTVPILLLGDFNILKDGYHRASDPTYASNGARYREMVNILTGAGFVELGNYNGGCDTVDLCTMNPWGNYSRLDYAFLFDPRKKFSSAQLTLLDPQVDGKACNLSDHRGLIVDLVLRTRRKKGRSGRGRS